MAATRARKAEEQEEQQRKAEEKHQQKAAEKQALVQMAKITASLAIELDVAPMAELVVSPKAAT
ncbi:uncharacterized protein PHACADRAFT_193056 [Phanerochaete carnosa HHB-10118-sp]|uniref:Uncharacterized protein n=1 Tax=Phanerochaete carnosa (strain HHB-10118-sp) TaxID=650164 RepID=K5WFR2_PHACS|nr:uncharacterized protein PHACADRAFT_193056 [Phanerochaete carnosa HHB-10118-sp]EKM57914.1 hypothetical protein PHACADRAFT_193056 [Phanerochaete carnosa HHB-10118-sp]